MEDPGAGGGKQGLGCDSTVFGSGSTSTRRCARSGSLRIERKRYERPRNSTLKTFDVIERPEDGIARVLCQRPWGNRPLDCLPPCIGLPRSRNSAILPYVGSIYGDTEKNFHISSAGHRKGPQSRGALSLFDGVGSKPSPPHRRHTRQIAGWNEHHFRREGCA